MTLYISASSYDRWHTCNRLYYFDQVLRYERAREAGAAAFGKLVHAGLEAWWRAMDGGPMPWRDVDAGLVFALKAIAEHATHVDTDPYDVAKAEAMLTAYHARYFELDFVTVDGAGDGVEVPFEIPLRDERGNVVPGWIVRGRKDALKKFRDGRTKAVEHKTSGSEIHGGASYWDRVAVDMQVSIYVDAAQQLGHPVSEALYDVLRKPNLKPYKKTPEDKRRMTKGKGCPHCGGRKGGKHGAAQGTGKIIVRTKVDGDGNPLPGYVDVETACTSCDGTGWHEAPHLDGNQRLEDETVYDYKGRVAEELASDFDAYFRMVTIKRDDWQLAEMRANLVTTTGIIQAMMTLAEQRSGGHMAHADARRVFPQNTRACLSVYGAECPFLLVCKGAVNPIDSKLYRIRTKNEAPR